MCKKFVHFWEFDTLIIIRLITKLIEISGVTMNKILSWICAYTKWYISYILEIILRIVLVSHIFK